MTAITMTVEAELEERLRFLGLSQSGKPVAQKVWQIIEPKLDGVLQAFYEEIARAATMSKLVENRVDYLKKRQRDHWASIFAMEFGPSYIERVTRVGNAHLKIGLDPSSSSAAYGVALCLMQGIVHDAFRMPGARREALNMLTRILFLDMTFSVGAYFDAMKRRQLEQFAGTERTATEVARAAQEAATAITQISDGAQVQIQVIRDVGHALGETRETTNQIATVVQTAAKQSSENVDAVSLGQDRMRELGRMMDMIKTNSAKIGKLAEYAERIAEQTTLLAVNAAIQASKATSREGAGFSVVAAEVGKLADQSNTSVQDITEIVKEAQRVADQGIAVANALERDIGALGDRSKAIRDLMVDVSRNMDTQQRNVGSVSKSMESLGEIGLASSTAAEEIAATMVDLSRMASGTLRDVQELRQREGSERS